MTFALIAALILTVALFAVLLDRKDSRNAEERAQHRRELADLLQRVQAPERAVVQHEVSQAMEHDPPQAPNSDEEHWKLSEEHLAAIAEIEARENAPWDRVS